MLAARRCNNIFNWLIVARVGADWLVLTGFRNSLHGMLVRSRRSRPKAVGTARTAHDGGSSVSGSARQYLPAIAVRQVGSVLRVARSPRKPAVPHDFDFDLARAAA